MADALLGSSTAALTIFPSYADTTSNTPQNGLYLVLRSSYDKTSLEPLAESEQVIKNDFHLLEPLEREKPIFLVIENKSFVPFSLGEKPTEDTEIDTGKPRLRLQLTPEQRLPLENFTRKNLGKTVAVIVGGDVVSTHKVKSVITGGNLQITRCTKHGCETLFTKLLSR